MCLYCSDFAVVISTISLASNNRTRCNRVYGEILGAIEKASQDMRSCREKMRQFHEGGEIAIAIDHSCKLKLADLAERYRPNVKY